MKLASKTLQALLVLSAAAVATPAVAQIVGFDVNFNSDATSYNNNFKRWSSTPDNPQGFTWSATGGVNGGGGLVVDNTAGNNLFYRPSAGNGSAGSDTSAFNINALAAGSAFETSVDFKWASTSSTVLTAITFGLGSTRTQAIMTSTGSFGGSLIRADGTNTVTLRMRNNNANAAGALSFDQSTLTAGNWYRLAFDFTKDSVANQFSYTVSLLSLGATGTSTPVILKDGSQNLVISGTISNSALYGDSDAFFAYDIRDNAGNTGISHVDNFVVGSAIPEPSSFAFLAGGLALGLVALRRRR